MWILVPALTVSNLIVKKNKITHTPWLADIIAGWSALGQVRKHVMKRTCTELTRPKFIDLDAELNFGIQAVPNRPEQTSVRELFCFEWCTVCVDYFTYICWNSRRLERTDFGLEHELKFSVIPVHQIHLYTRPWEKMHNRSESIFGYSALVLLLFKKIKNI
jgi:hypothetical protein